MMLYFDEEGTAQKVDEENTVLVDEKELEDFINKFNEQGETLQKQNQEITACHDTLTTIHELCDAVLNYDFKNVEDKIDFCHMLNEMDNKDLRFLKECFEAIKDNDLKRMISLTVECNGDVE
ncbi:hypothetical protein [uncultured Methanobrevibacter sp.]|uniref:hypothetical protein n=1 Tax=uncultured Methanobrevibacter sp. TaxID=253161 RepID=UPI0025E18F75|nr:hypothetical protein [uncultured Methanobrevibacter sp.]